MQIAVGAVLLLVSPLAAAEDSGTGGIEEDAGVPLPGRDAAVFFDAATIACDGGLCDTQTGTTCDLAGASPGRISPSVVSPFAILAALALAAGHRRSARLPARRVALGRRAHPAGLWRARASRRGSAQKKTPKTSQ
jgi:hypothetical protein